MVGLGADAARSRMAGMSAITAVGFVTAALLLKHRSTRRTGSRRMDRLAAVFFGLLALAMVVRSALALAPSVPMATAWLFTLVVFPALFTAGSLCLLLGYVGDSLAVTARLAVTDPLTGIANRRGFVETASAALVQANASGIPVVLVIADVDGLKAINDRFGHPAGDAVLKAAADVLLRDGGGDDRLARLGGDEFGLLVVGSDRVTVAARMERAQARLKALTPAGLPPGLAGLSFGLAEQSPTTTLDFPTLYALADADLLKRRAALRAIV